MFPTIRRISKSFLHVGFMQVWFGLMHDHIDVKLVRIQVWNLINGSSNLVRNMIILFKYLLYELYIHCSKKCFMWHKLMWNESAYKSWKPPLLCRHPLVIWVIRPHNPLNVFQLFIDFRVWNPQKLDSWALFTVPGIQETHFFLESLSRICDLISSLDLHFLFVISWLDSWLVPPDSMLR